ncbi:MAG: hypothetical protein R2912_00595 [Eubacteriales bacterium]
MDFDTTGNDGFVAGQFQRRPPDGTITNVGTAANTFSPHADSGNLCRQLYDRRHQGHADGHPVWTRSLTVDATDVSEQYDGTAYGVRQCECAHRHDDSLQ